MADSSGIYGELAGYYDQFCADVDYAGQCAFARRVFATFASSDAKQYLDLACGTGQHLLDMQQHGFAPHGLDNSSAMLALAAQRCSNAQLQLCDLAAFAQQDSFDLITCFLYSIHYAHPVAAVEQTLRRSFAALKRGGVLLFNAVDARGIRNDAGITTYLDEGEDALSFQSAWFYRGEGEVLDLNLLISKKSRRSATTEQSWRDHHVMTSLTFPQLEKLLQDVGFDVTILEHDYATLHGWEGDSFNAVFVACKP
jgi:SAM-dependent methyltransferase